MEHSIDGEEVVERWAVPGVMGFDEVRIHEQFVPFTMTFVSCEDGVVQGDHGVTVKPVLDFSCPIWEAC